MSFIANTAFEARLTNNALDQLAQVAGIYRVSTTDTDCSAGLLVTRSAKVPHSVFTGVYNENAYYMVAATDAANVNDVIYACDPHDWPLVATANGNKYAVGSEMLGLGAPAGHMTNYTRIDFDGQHIYRFGVGNLSTSLGANEYFTIANGLLVPAASAPTTAGAIYFELVGKGNFTEGTTSSFAYVDVVAKKNIVATA